MHGASEQCMHATEMLRSPGTPSLMVTTRRRLTPHGMSCSCLHAVTQPLHSMQRSASHKNFIRAMNPPSGKSEPLLLPALFSLESLAKPADSRRQHHSR